MNRNELEGTEHKVQKKRKIKMIKKQVEQSLAIRCDLRRYCSINDSLTVHFISSCNAQNLSEQYYFHVTYRDLPLNGEKSRFFMISTRA